MVMASLLQDSCRVLLKAFCQGSVSMHCDGAAHANQRSSMLTLISVPPLLSMASKARVTSRTALQLITLPCIWKQAATAPHCQ